MTDPPTPAERFALILEWLKKAIAAAIAIHMPAELIVMIWKKVNRVSLQVTRIEALIRKGKYHPRGRDRKPRKKPTLRSPRVRHPYPRRAGWMLRLIPGVAGPRGWLETLLADPEMVALIAAAPQMVQPIRSLCFMLLIPPPPILARPKARPAAPTPPPPPPPEPAAPVTVPAEPPPHPAPEPRNTPPDPAPPQARAPPPPA